MRSLVLACAGLLAAGAPAAAQDFTTLKGHGGPVMGIDVNPATGQVATASFDNSVGLWEGRDPRWLEGHDAAVITVQFLDEETAASGSDDFDVILWSLPDGAATRLEGHQGKVAEIALSPDGDTLATASWDGSIGLWPRGGGQARFLKGHNASVSDVTFSADGTRLYSASADGTIRIWQVNETDGAPRVLVNAGFGVNRLILDPNDQWLAYGAVDGVTRVVDPMSGDTVRDFSLDRRPILSMAYHDASGQLAVGDGHGFIMMIDTGMTDTGAWQIVKDFRAMRQGPVWALDFSPDGTMIYAGGIEDVAFGWPVADLDAFDPAGSDQRSFLRDPEAMPNGERQFMRKCSICHALTPPPSRKAGPSLHGLFGRKAGAVPGYPYSEILDGSDIVWSEGTIDALFDLGPDHYIPGSKMPMQRITAGQDRQDLIDYLREATEP